MESDKEIISKLKFIGRIQKDEKVNVKYMYVQPLSFLTTISRMIMNKDNRNNTLAFIYETIQRSFELILTYERSEKPSDHVMKDHIIEDLVLAKSGMTNLKTTYSDDTKFCCDIDTFTQIIDAKLGI